MTGTIDSLSRRLDNLSVRIPRPLKRGSHEFNMQVFTPEEQERLTAFLVELTGVESVKELSDSQLDELSNWFDLEGRREVGHA